MLELSLQLGPKRVGEVDFGELFLNRVNSRNEVQRTRVGDVEQTLVLALPPEGGAGADRIENEFLALELNLNLALARLRHSDNMLLF